MIASNVSLLLGDWERAEEGAKIFDNKRPHNLSSRWVLFLCAARKGDTEAVAALKKKTIEFKSDRPAYQAVQRVLKGEESWDIAKQTLLADDPGFNVQAVTTLVACFVAEGNLELAATIRDDALASGIREMELHHDTALHSMQRGALASFWKK